MINTISQWILTILLAFPALAGAVIFLLPKKYDEQGCLAKKIALAAALLEFIFSLHLAYYFFPDSAAIQFAQVLSWMPSLGINYVVGVDGLSLILVLLTTALTPLVLLLSFSSVREKISSLVALILFLESCILGVFVSLDVVQFYMFWEASLIPVYFMIGIWGGKERIYATLKFFIYGFLGSVLMLVAFAYLYFAHAELHNGIPSAQLFDLYKTAIQLPLETKNWLFAAVTLAFAIKVPLFPFHTWLMDTYEQAPGTYTVMSGVILKLATYGLIRFAILLFPESAQNYAHIVMLLGVIGILYGAIIAWRQDNLRRLMAYSSLSHLGFIIVGIFSLQIIGFSGALYQMVNHAVTAGALFILLNILEQRKGTMDINAFGGLAKSMPWFAFFFVIAALGAVALPGTGSFLGEWLILLGAFKVNVLLASIAALGVIFGAIYMLWMVYKVVWGPLETAELKTKDISKVEFVQLSLLSIVIFVMGFCFTPVMNHTQATLSHIQLSVETKRPYMTLLTNYSENGEVRVLNSSSVNMQTR